MNETSVSPPTTTTSQQQRLAASECFSSGAAPLVVSSSRTRQQPLPTRSSGPTQKSPIPFPVDDDLCLFRACCFCIHKIIRLNDAGVEGVETNYCNEFVRRLLRPRRWSGRQGGQRAIKVMRCATDKGSWQTWRAVRTAMRPCRAAMEAPQRTLRGHWWSGGSGGPGAGQDREGGPLAPPGRAAPASSQPTVAHFIRRLSSETTHSLLSPGSTAAAGF